MNLVVFANENRFARGIPQNESGCVCRLKMLCSRNSTEWVWLCLPIENALLTEFHRMSLVVFAD
jgi:hypothetical protein